MARGWRPDPGGGRHQGRVPRWHRGRVPPGRVWCHGIARGTARETGHRCRGGAAGGMRGTRLRAGVLVPWAPRGVLASRGGRGGTAGNGAPLPPLVEYLRAAGGDWGRWRVERMRLWLGQREARGRPRGLSVAPRLSPGSPNEGESGPLLLLRASHPSLSPRSPVLIDLPIQLVISAR